jgi:hypothetical protein
MLRIIKPPCLLRTFLLCICMTARTAVSTSAESQLVFLGCLQRILTVHINFYSSQYHFVGLPFAVCTAQLLALPAVNSAPESTWLCSTLFRTLDRLQLLYDFTTSFQCCWARLTVYHSGYVLPCFLLVLRTACVRSDDTCLMV